MSVGGISSLPSFPASRWDKTDEVRLIIDPANCASTRPVNGIRLVGLRDAPAIVVAFGPPPVVGS